MNDPTRSVRLDTADGIATIRLERPPMNVLDSTIQRAIATAAAEAAERDDIAAVVLYGGPRVFAAGADIREMADRSFAEMVDASHRITESLDAVARIGKPVVAAITGYALGGGLELALAADIRFAAADAKLGQPEIKLGLIPGAGGTQRLPRLVGPARAKELIFTGRMIDAAEAYRIGLVDEITESDPYDRALAWAAQFVGGPRLAIRAAKAAVDHGLNADLATGRELERQHFASLFATRDREIGMAAFVAKETPRFEGR